MPSITQKKFSWFKKLTPTQQDAAWREKRRRFREQNDAIAAAASTAFAETMTTQVTRGAELAAQNLLNRVTSDLESKKAQANKSFLDVSV